MDPKISKKTQDTLGKIIKKPPLTEKLLGKPPFRFLHDIVTSVIKTTGFMQGLYADTELNSENVKDKDAKIAFLQKAIDMVCAVTGKSLSVKPAKIVAGHEPERTNELLQSLADAINKNVDNDEYVKKVLKGGGGGGSAKEERREEKKEKEEKREKDRTKSADRRKGRDSEEKDKHEKDRGDRERSRDKGDRERDREKRHDKDRDKDREKDRDRDKDKDRHKDRDKERDRDSKTREKSRDSRDDRHRERSKREETGSKDMKAKEKMLADGKTASHSTPSSNNGTADKGKGSPAGASKISKFPPKSPASSPQKSKEQTGKLTPWRLSDGQARAKIQNQPQEIEDAAHKLPHKKPGQDCTSHDTGKLPAIPKNFNSLPINGSEAEYSALVASQIQRNPGGDGEIPKISCRVSSVIAERNPGLSSLRQGEGDHSNKETLLGHRERSHEKENESPDRNKDKVNGEKEEKQEAPARLQRPSSAKGSRRRREEDDEFQKPMAPSKDAVMGEGDLPPQVAAARQLARPSSARPAPPRPKQEALESEPAMRLGGGQPTNVIADDDNEDDDENFLVEESAPPPPEPDTTPLKPPDEEDAQHGSLVKKMLESKKELEGGNQAGPAKKTEIERPVMSDAQRRKQREMVQKEVDKLRASIQSLTRSANPLGKVMDYVQEDLDSMQQELEKWRSENAQHALDLKREMNVTDRAIEPLKQQLTEVERAIGDQLDQIAATKCNIIKNDQKIQKMLRGISSS